MLISILELLKTSDEAGDLVPGPVGVNLTVGIAKGSGREKGRGGGNRIPILIRTRDCVGLICPY